MSAVRSGAFLSYARDDDKSSHGFISDLHDEISMEMRSRTGVPFPVFQDRQDIRGGDQWDERILTALRTSQFLLPIVTPSFVRSEACQREVLLFRSFQDTLGNRNSIIPLYYIDIDSVDFADTASAEVITILRSCQYIDLRNYRGKRIKALSNVIIDIGAEILNRLIEFRDETASETSDVSVGQRRSVDRAGPRIVSSAPSDLALDFRDRREVFPILVNNVEKADTKLSVLVGSVGAGKTAVISHLQSRIESGDSLQDLSAFAYLDARGARPATVATVVDDLADCFQDEAARDRVHRQLREGEYSWYDAIELVLHELGSREVLYVIDGAEVLLDSNGHIKNDAFRNLLEIVTTRTDHRVHFLLISSVRMTTRFKGYGPSDATDLREGLPFEEIEPLVALWSRPDSPWRQVTSEAAFKKLHDLIGGSPRLLELLLNAGATWTSRTPPMQLEMLMSVRRDDIHSFLLQAAVRAMTRKAMSVVLVFAAFGRPVPQRAASALLGFDPEETISSLLATRFIRRDRSNYYLPPDDAVLILAEATSGNSFEQYELTRRDTLDLVERAANWLGTEAALNPVNRVEDLAYHLREIELLLRVADYEKAFLRLSEIDVTYLERWGHSDVVSDMRLRIEGKLESPNDELRNLAQYANAKSQQEEHSTALAAVDRAGVYLNELPGTERPRAVQLLALMQARIAYDDGRTADAETFYRTSVDSQIPALARSEYAQALAGAALCRAEVGDFEGALGGLIKAQDYLGQTTDPGSSYLQVQLIYNQGLNHLYLGDFTKAVTLLGQASIKARNAGDFILEAVSVDALALVRYCENDLGSARKLATRATQMAVRLGSPKVSRNAYGTLSLIELRRGVGGEALAAAEAAARYAGSRKGWGALAILGIARFKTGDTRGARGIFFEALDYAQRILWKEPRNFQALEFKGLILVGLALASAENYLEEAVIAYTDARTITKAQGVVQLCRAMLEDLLAPEVSENFRKALFAAEGRDA